MYLAPEIQARHSSSHGSRCLSIIMKASLSVLPVDRQVHTCPGLSHLHAKKPFRVRPWQGTAWELNSYVKTGPSWTNIIIKRYNGRQNHLPYTHSLHHAKLVRRKLKTLLSVVKLLELDAGNSLCPVRSRHASRKRGYFSQIDIEAFWRSFSLYWRSFRKWKSPWGVRKQLSFLLQVAVHYFIQFILKQRIFRHSSTASLLGLF